MIKKSKPIDRIETRELKELARLKEKYGTKIIYSTDKVIESVINKIIDRADTGMIKYKTSMAGNDGGVLVWLKHAQQELMDAVNYIEKLIQLFEAPDGADRG